MNKTIRFEIGVSEEYLLNAIDKCIDAAYNVDGVPGFDENTIKALQILRCLVQLLALRG